MTTSPGLTTLNVIIEEAQHQQRDRSGVTQLPEPVSPSYRSQSPNWNTATGANMSTMNRDSTGTAHEACDSACDRSVTAARRERHDLVIYLHVCGGGGRESNPPDGVHPSQPL